MESSSSTQITPVVSNKKHPNSWTTDGVDGKRSSMQIILDWFTSPSNYNRYKGGDIKKTILLDEIIRLMKSEGIHHRNARGVRSKIDKLQSSYRSVVDWLSQTGKSIRETDLVNGVAPEVTESTIKKYIQKKCPYYDLLLPVIGTTRPSSVPPIPNVSEGDNSSVADIPSGPRNRDDDVDEPLEEVIPTGEEESTIVLAALERSSSPPEEFSPEENDTISISSGTAGRPLSFSTSTTADQRASKKARFSVGNILAEILKSSEKAESDKLALEREKLAEEKGWLTLERERFEEDKRRYLEERKERDEERDMKKIQLQLEMYKMWRSLGKTNEEISKLLAETF